MGLALLLVSLVALCLGIFGWLWLAGGALRGGWRGALGLAALQASGLCLIWGFVKGAPLVGLYTALFPPLALFDLVSLADHGAFLARVLAKAAPWGVGVLAVGLVWRRLRPWAPGLGLAALVAAGAIQGEAVSLRLMCETAAARGLDDLRRASLTESLARRSAESPRPPHATARGEDGQTWGWSYREMDWEVWPDAAIPYAGLQPADCGPGG